MGILLLFAALFGGIIAFDDVEGDVMTQVETYQLIAAGVVLLVGAVLHIFERRDCPCTEETCGALTPHTDDKTED